MASEKKAGKKSIKVVLFDEDNDTHSNQNADMAEEIEGLIVGVNKLAEFNADSGMSSMDVETEQKENKENTRRKGRLVRQNATTEDK